MNQQLSEFFLEKVKSECQENETRKKQSMELCRDWALKHRFIRVVDPRVLSKLKHFFKNILNNLQ